MSPTGSRSTILVVEDNPTTRKLVRFTLEQRGYRVLEAGDGARAIDLVRSGDPDLVLQDLLLPDVDGFELVGRLRTALARPEIPILAFSGLVSKLEEARMSAVGFDDQIVKPCEPSRLAQVIAAHLPDPAGDPTRFGLGRRLIVADDDPVQRKLAAFRLERAGFEVTCASDGAEALALAKQRRPDAIVSDVMMPNVDGFRLCIEARHDPALRGLPIVLVTSSYVDADDSRLAEQAGATAYVVRTPDLRAVLDELQRTLAATRPMAPERVVPSDVEREHARRVVRQLERQVQLNAGMTQRCALLSAQVSILTGISDALTHRGGLDDAVDEAIATCFDAGGISSGALALRSAPDEPRVRTFGSVAWPDEVRAALLDLVDRLEGPEPILVVPPPADREPEPFAAALVALGTGSALLVPLCHRGERLGALLLASETAALLDDDRQAFGVGVANQVALAVALAGAFQEKDRALATLRTVLDSLEDGVVVADPRGTSTFWNAAAERMVGAPEPPALLLADRITALEPDAHPMARAIRGERSGPVELHAPAEPGADGRVLLASGTPLVDGGGASIGAVAVFRDVTEERAAQEGLLASDRMASIGLLSAGIAHEINNPLQVTLTNLELARPDLQLVLDGAPADGVTRRLQAELADATHSARRVADIVCDLKIFAHPSDGRPTRVDLREVLESTLRLAWNEIRHRAQLVKRLEPVEPVAGNASRLGQVFLNLAVNAAQAIPEGDADRHRIEVSTRMEDRTVVVEIRDTGVGIPTHAMNALFTPFFTTKPAGIGTGLGLSIAKRIVEASGGRISVWSEVGKGTTFRVALPAMADAPPPDVAAPSEPSLPISTGRARILVVDDEAMVLTVIRRVLQEHDVIATTSPREALARLAGGERFDLVLCDLMMPAMTGMELHAELAKVAPALVDRIIFLTGGAFTDRARAFLDEVRPIVLEKPFGAPELREVVARKLG